MYVEPSTNIRILKDVPLDNTYEHTLYFESVTAQSEYFTSKAKFVLTNQTYQRVNRGYARVQKTADELYDCNYMMFQNSGFGNKWFYAFITGVEYINNVTTEIQFEIDDMQTWYFDHRFEMSFVEREHSVTDEIGDNIIPEGLDLGEYVFNGSYADLTNTLLEELIIVVLISDEQEEPNAALFDGVYGGCHMFVYRTDTLDAVKNKINEYAQKPEAIVGMYMAPRVAFDDVIGDMGEENTGNTEGAVITITTPVAANKNMSIDGYVPKNKKLLTYPYNYFHVDAGGEQSTAFRYEFFDNLKPEFKIDTCLTMPVECTLRPIHYKGSVDRLSTEAITLKNYPMCSWSTDAFRAWLAQNSLPILGTTGAIVAGATAATTFGASIPLLAGLSGANAVAGLLGNGYKASIQADITKGNLSHGNSNIASHTHNFYSGRVSISKQYGKMIDDYFTMYGYATNMCKIPNYSARPHWNYLKTRNVNLTGSVPANAMKHLCQIYDNGITFWKNPSEVGDYNLDNSPV